MWTNQMWTRGLVGWRHVSSTSSAYVDDAMSSASVDDATWLPRHCLPCHMPAWTTARGRLVSWRKQWWFALVKKKSHVIWLTTNRHERIRHLWWKMMIHHRVSNLMLRLRRTQICHKFVIKHILWRILNHLWRKCFVIDVRFSSSVCSYHLSPLFWEF